MNEEERKIYNYKLEVIKKFKGMTDMTESQRAFYQEAVKYVKQIDGRREVPRIETIEDIEKTKEFIFKPMITDDERTKMQEYNARFERNNK